MNNMVCGYFDEMPQGITFLSKYYKAKTCVVAHTLQQTIETRIGGKVIAIVTSKKNGVNGKVLLMYDNF